MLATQKVSHSPQVHTLSSFSLFLALEHALELPSIRVDSERALMRV